MSRCFPKYGTARELHLALKVECLAALNWTSSHVCQLRYTPLPLPLGLPHCLSVKRRSYVPFDKLTTALTLISLPTMTVIFWLAGGLIRPLASAAVTVTPQPTVRERGLLTNLPFESLSGGEISRERTPSTRGLPSRSAYAEPIARTTNEGSG